MAKVSSDVALLEVARRKALKEIDSRNTKDPNLSDNAVSHLSNLAMVIAELGYEQIETLNDATEKRMSAMETLAKAVEKAALETGKRSSKITSDSLTKSLKALTGAMETQMRSQADHMTQLVTAMVAHVQENNEMFTKTVSGKKPVPWLATVTERDHLGYIKVVEIDPVEYDD